MSFLSTLAQSSNYYDYNYNYSYDNSLNSADSAAVVGIMFFIYGIQLLLIIAFYIIKGIFLGKIFKKAGVEAWKAWVPFYNDWVLLELGGQQGFWAVLQIVPFVNIAAIIFIIIAHYHIGLKLQKDGAFVLLAIFLSPVWYIWLGTDKSVWQGARPAGNVEHGSAPQPPAAPTA